MKTECPFPGTILPVQQRRRVVGRGRALVVVLLGGHLRRMACEHGGGLEVLAVMVAVEWAGIGGCYGVVVVGGVGAG